MDNFIDVGYSQLTKKNEEICGDRVEIARTDDGVIAVMSDGLGSGIKANILATLTSKIAITMLKNGEELSEVIDTIINTLPVCKEREIAYSTLTIIYTKKTGDTYIVEFDNPSVFYYNKEKNIVSKLKYNTITINGRIVLEAQCHLKENDSIIAVSDGIIHAGAGEVLNYGWEWEHVAKYLQGICLNKNAMMISKSLTNICNDLYNDKPGDDATVVAMKMKKPQVFDLFTGPPLLKEKDPVLVEKFMDSPGKKIICGGTAANIVARELQRDLVMDVDTVTEKIPPICHMEGIYLITEGVLTMEQTLNYLREFLNNTVSSRTIRELEEQNGATILANTLLYECTHINFYLGHCLNAAYRNEGFPQNLQRKFKMVGQIINSLRKLGKIVSIYYF
ncbi:SpoIIE family protein phosphatase [Natronincola ferrireducens]|nr:SpoIIE family protein phosphatase [Natronincola ferrireducens]